MRTLACAATLVAFAVSAGTAQGEDRSGVLKSFHGASRILVLDDGSQYHVPDDVAVPLFRSGDKVRLSAEQRGGRQVITRLTVVE